ncbi:hypothetical protein MY11210_003939 [Beauveria gryllotalpidicola]
MVLDFIVGAEATIVMLLALLLRSSTNPALLGVSLDNILSFNASLVSVIGGWTLFKTSLGALTQPRSFEQNMKPEDQPWEVCEPPKSWPAEGTIGCVAWLRRTGSTSLFQWLVESRKLADMPQDASVLMGTLRSNTNPAGQHADGDIQAVLRRVGLWNFVESGNNGWGLDAEMTTASLSHGQRQLLVDCAGGVLLDETTTALTKRRTPLCSGFCGTSLTSAR